MATQIIRFETREEINKAIAYLVERGVALDEIDVELTKIGVVDLDLCVTCLHEIAERMSETRKVA
jgi:predicted phosphatase